MRAIPTKIHINLLLAITLVFAQSILLIHQTDIDKHKAGEICEYCQYIGSLGNPLASDIPALFSFSASGFIYEIPYITLVVSRYYSVALARAPPFLQ